MRLAAPSCCCVLVRSSLCCHLFRRRQSKDLRFLFGTKCLVRNLHFEYPLVLVPLCGQRSRSAVIIINVLKETFRKKSGPSPSALLVVLKGKRLAVFLAGRS
jgi:hypothetical protein